MCATFGVCNTLNGRSCCGGKRDIHKFLDKNGFYFFWGYNELVLLNESKNLLTYDLIFLENKQNHDRGLNQETQYWLSEEVS